MNLFGQAEDSTATEMRESGARCACSLFPVELFDYPDTEADHTRVMSQDEIAEVLSW